MPRTRARLPLSRAGAALAALVLVSTVLRAAAGLRIDSLWIAPDEMIYGALGLSIWQDGDLRIWGGEPRLYGFAYPLLAGAPLALAGLDAGYDALKVLQALVMSLTAVPVYVWARRLASPAWALVAAALTLALPGLLYTGLIMSEVLAYPTMVMAAWAMAEALERPTAGRQALLVGAIALAAATRLQGLVLPLVLVTAVALHALLERDLRRPLRLAPAVGALVALGVAWLAWRWAAIGSASGALGSYSEVAGAGYGAWTAARAVVEHAAAVLLMAAIFPACAAALLAVRALAGREESPAARAYVATAVALAAWLVVQVGVFASAFLDVVATRYLLPLGPVLFVGFAAWLSRGGPRTRLAAGGVALAALALLLALPLRDAVVQDAVIHSFVLVPLLWLREHSSEAQLELAVWGGAAAALALFALVPRRALVLLPALALAGLAFASAAATREVIQNVAFDREHLVGGSPRWVDELVRRPAAYLYVGEQPLNIVWHQLFWNERLEQVYVLGLAGPAGSLPVAMPLEVRPDGLLVGLGEPYAVAVNAVTLAGEPVGGVELEYQGQTGLTLWQVDPPARILSLRTGVRENGDLHGPARIDVWDCQEGQLELTLLPKASSRAELRANGRVVQTLRFQGEEYVNATIHPPPGAGHCVFEIFPDSLLGSTRVEFVRR